ncbi:hypothetical protein BD410DRAFT_451456 [Rickenella mellea]|uniref:Uncharacterized protein n=1 Tax=Rickenella mellea TaxID=50990 RepID=A0A4Y7PU64_9AGAM|nr:hypothetical protein BD410DRAFT_451456 [Rickenella mellea]
MSTTANLIPPLCGCTAVAVPKFLHFLHLCWSPDRGIIAGAVDTGKDETPTNPFLISIDDLISISLHRCINISASNATTPSLGYCTRVKSRFSAF